MNGLLGTMDASRGVPGRLRVAAEVGTFAQVGAAAGGRMSRANELGMTPVATCFGG